MNKNRYTQAFMRKSASHNLDCSLRAADRGEASKDELREMLRQAVQNTAELTQESTSEVESE